MSNLNFNQNKMVTVKPKWALSIISAKPQEIDKVTIATIVKTKDLFHNGSAMSVVTSPSNHDVFSATGRPLS